MFEILRRLSRLQAVLHFVALHRLVLLFLMAVVACDKKVAQQNGGNNGQNSPSESKIMVSGYLPSYGFGRFKWENLSQVNRVYYFSIEPTVDGNYQMTPSDSANIEWVQSKLAPSQELFLVIGGWVESKNIPVMAADPAKRATYISQVTGFCKRHGLRGVDLDWEDNPAPINQVAFTSLVHEMFASFHAAGLKFTIALDEGKAAWVSGFKDHVDEINIMSYAALDAMGNHSSILQMKSALDKFEARGMPKAKLHAGVPFYGLRATAPHALEYYKIVALASPGPGINTYDNYSFNGRDMLKEKTAYLRQNGYGGIFAWELSQDVELSSAFSLLKAIVDRNK